MYGADFGGMAKMYARMNYVEYAKVSYHHLLKTVNQVHVRSLIQEFTSYNHFSS